MDGYRLTLAGNVAYVYGYATRDYSGFLTEEIYETAEDATNALAEIVETTKRNFKALVAAGLITVDVF